MEEDELRFRSGLEPGHVGLRARDMAWRLFAARRYLGDQEVLGISCRASSILLSL